MLQIYFRGLLSSDDLPEDIGPQGTAFVLYQNILCVHKRSFYYCLKQVILQSTTANPPTTRETEGSGMQTNKIKRTLSTEISISVNLPSIQII